jgi:putative SOS response-associated peptidase YedK
MCGRFAIDIDTPTFVRRFHVRQMEIKLEPHYNVAPGMYLLVVIHRSPNQAVLMKWGLVPHWSREPKVKFSTINARAETLESSAVYRMPFARQRCLLPAIGFYEWAKLEDGSKWPYYFSVKNRSVFAFAGLWDKWTDVEGKEFLSCTIVTCPANEVVARIHPRMPVIIEETDEDAWLTSSDMAKVKAILKPYEPTQMSAVRVSKSVNSTQNDDRSLIDEFIENKLI